MDTFPFVRLVRDQKTQKLFYRSEDEGWRYGMAWCIGTLGALGLMLAQEKAFGIDSLLRSIPLLIAAYVVLGVVLTSSVVGLCMFKIAKHLIGIKLRRTQRRAGRLHTVNIPGEVVGYWSQAIVADQGAKRALDPQSSLEEKLRPHFDIFKSVEADWKYIREMETSDPDQVSQIEERRQNLKSKLERAARSLRGLW